MNCRNEAEILVGLKLRRPQNPYRMARPHNQPVKQAGARVYPLGALHRP